MALSNHPMTHDSCIGLVQESTHYSAVFGESSPGLYVADEHHKSAFENQHDSGKASCFVKNFGTGATSSSSLSSPSSTNSNRLVFQPSNYELEEARSLINFKSSYHGLLHARGSLLSFKQRSEMIGDRQDQDGYESNVWEDALSPRIVGDFSSTIIASVLNGAAEQEGEPLGWLTTESSAIANIETTKQFGAQDTSFNKRLHTGGESTQLAAKKQCTAATRKPKPKSRGSTPSKDPQSIAAKNRRERISERLKILQELVPNGSKVDLVTMLEKAISYVKFLQLQVKVLAADEFWPMQGGKAPDLSQVKEAIDAILSSQKGRNSSSK